MFLFFNYVQVLFVSFCFAISVDAYMLNVQEKEKANRTEQIFLDLVAPDSELSLAEGAVDLWPGVSKDLSKRMLAAFCESTGIPSDVPYDQLGKEHRRILFRGTADRWFNVLSVSGERQLSFQFKGLNYRSLYGKNQGTKDKRRP